MLIAKYVKADGATRAPEISRHLSIGGIDNRAFGKTRRINGIVTFASLKDAKDWLKYNMKHIQNTLCMWHDCADINSECDIFGDFVRLEFDIVCDDCSREFGDMYHYSLSIHLQSLLEWLLDDAETAIGYIDGKLHNYKTYSERQATKHEEA